MHAHLIEEATSYHGFELTSHWIYEYCGLQGDAIVAFHGPCKVHLNDMVDLEDVQRKADIHSEHMLHFIIEHFQTPLSEIVLRQRLLIAQLQQLFHNLGQSQVMRKGDDLMDGDKKISVSIATVSPVSALIHCGINISSQNTPVPAQGLDDYGINWRHFALIALETYKAEHESIGLACTKVRWVK